MCQKIYANSFNQLQSLLDTKGVKLPKPNLEPSLKPRTTNSGY